MRARRVLISAVAAVLLAAIAAALLRDPVPPTVRQLRGAPSLVHSARPVRLRLELSLVDPDGTVRSVDMASEIDEERDRAHTTLADVIGPGDLELVAQGSVLYLSVPDARQAELGARWLRVAAGSRAAARGAGVGPLPDPLSVLHALEGVTDAERGTTTSRGDGQLTLHRFRTSVAELADRGGEDRVAWAEVLHPLGPVIAGEAYLDADGFPCRVRLRSDLGPRGEIVAVLDVNVLTEGLTIAIPPADAVRGVDTIADALRIASGEFEPPTFEIE